MINQERFISEASKYGITITEVQADSFDKYAELLVEWNKVMNLTGITEPQQIEEKHFIDSLLLAMQPEVKGSVIDVGTGAGFPGIVVKIYNNEAAVTLMEPTGKRVNFLTEVCNQLKLNCDIVRERAEEAARKKWREKYDVAVARAVAALPALCEYCMPLVKPGGYFIAMKGDSTQEIEDAENAIKVLGGKLQETRQFELPDGSFRTLVFIRKVSTTPAVYPRGSARIAGKPL